MSEFLRSQRVVASVLALGLGMTACGNGGGEEEQASCLSPRFTSPRYEGDPQADPTDQSTWTTGIEVKTELPADAEGLIIGFSGINEPFWEDSKPVPSEKADSIALRIGPGDVEFSTQIQAPEGSAACDERPDSFFNEPQPFADILERGAVMPEWPDEDTD